MKTLLLIYNPGAGKQQFSSKRAREELSAELQLYSLEGEWVSLSQLDVIDVTAYKLIVIVGGDGTISTVVNQLAKVAKKIKFAIIPAGTFNHLAKDLNLPEDPSQCIRIIAQGQTTKIDVAEVNGRFFLNNSSLGLYPKSLRYRRLYKRLTKWVALFVSVINVFKDFPVMTVQFQFETKQREVMTPLVFISNNQYKLDLIALTERKRLDEGKLFLYLNESSTRTEFLYLLLTLFFRRRKRLGSKFKIHAVEECQLNLKKSKIDVAVDGEVQTLATPLIYKIHKQHLTVIIPKDAHS